MSDFYTVEGAKTAFDRIAEELGKEPTMFEFIKHFRTDNTVRVINDDGDTIKIAPSIKFSVELWRSLEAAEGVMLNFLKFRVSPDASNLFVYNETKKMIVRL